MTITGVRHARRILVPLMVVSLLLVSGVAFADPMVMSLDDSQILIGADGKAVTQPGQYDSIYQLGGLSGGQAVLFAAAGADGKYALLDATGKQLTDFLYEGLDLSQNYVVFTTGGLTGAMDEKGTIVVPAQYTMLSPVGDGAFLALRTDPYDDAADGVYRVDAQGGEKATGAKIVYGLGELSGGLMPATSAQDGRYGYLNAEGQWAIEPQYNYCGPFQGGFAEAGIASGSGIINAQGNWVVTPKYTSAAVGFPDKGAPFVVADADGAVTLISSKDFKAIRTLKGDGIWAYALDNGLVVSSDGKGQTVYDYQGDERFSVKAGQDLNAWDATGDVVVVTEGEWGTDSVWLTDFSGKHVAGPYQGLTRMGEVDGVAVFEYDTYEVVAQKDSGGSAYYTQRAGTFRAGLINAKGDVLVEAKYDSLALVGEGFLRAETPAYFALINLRGEEIVRFDRYKDLVD